MTTLRTPKKPSQGKRSCTNPHEVKNVFTMLYTLSGVQISLHKEKRLEQVYSVFRTSYTPLYTQLI